MTAPDNPLEQNEPGPSTFLQERYRRARALHVWEIRYHLSIYPKDLCRYWASVEGRWPPATSAIAFKHYRAGHKIGRLYKGPLHWQKPKPKLKMIQGGKV